MKVFEAGRTVLSGDSIQEGGWSGESGLPAGYDEATDDWNDTGDVVNDDDVDVEYLPTTHLEKVESSPYKHENGAHEIQASLDHFLQTTFVEVYDKIWWADAFTPDTALKDSQDWADISTKVFDATQAFKDEVDLINQEGWTGYTHEAAMDNIGKSYAEPETASGGAGVMAFLVEAFEETIWATKENIVSKKESYELLTDYYEDHRRDGVINTYNDFARKVMVEVYPPTSSRSQ